MTLIREGDRRFGDRLCVHKLFERFKILAHSPTSLECDFSSVALQGLHCCWGSCMEAVEKFLLFGCQYSTPGQKLGEHTKFCRLFASHFNFLNVLSDEYTIQRAQDIVAGSWSGFSGSVKDFMTS